MRLDIQLFADGKVVIETKLDTSGFEDGLDDMENGSALSQFIGEIKEKLTSIGIAMQDAIKKAGTGFKGIAKSVLSVGSIITKTMGKVILSAIRFSGALIGALGIIGLLALAFLSVIEAAKKIGEENKQLKADIQYIIFSLKTALQPVIDAIANAIVKIINFLITIFKYAMMIASAIAGRNLFEKATPEAFAKSMKDANKSSSGIAKNAKEIKKQLAGFDEMNVLQDNTASGGSGGVATPVIKPSFDWANLEEPEWIKKIRDHFNRLKTEWQTTKGILKKDWQDLKTKITDWWTNLKTQWESFKVGFSNSWTDLKDKVVGHFEKLGAEWENFKLGVQASANEIKYKVIEKWTEIKDKINEVIEKIKTKWGELKTKITEIISPIINKFNEMKDKISNTFTTIKDKATTIFTNIKTFIVDKIVKPITDKFNSFKTTITDIFGKIRDALKGPLNTMISWVNKLIDGLNKVSIKVPAWVNEMLGKGYKESKWGFDIKKIPKLAKGGVINMPGRGTPIAYGGERGAEGVIPLTDSQQMQLLGEAIGKYITINANITNSMNGRVISRELQKINNENAFAGNR